MRKFFFILLTLVPTPATALERDVPGGYKARTINFAEWVIFHEVADKAASRGRAACLNGQADAEKDYICMGPAPGELGLAMIAAGNTPESMAALARQLRYAEASPLSQKAYCHALRKGAAMGDYFDPPAAEKMAVQCESDMYEFLNRRGKGLFKPPEICASAVQITERFEALLNGAGHEMGCAPDDDPAAMGEQAMLYDRAISSVPGARTICGEKGYPCGMMVELGLAALEFIDSEAALASLARVYRFQSDAGLSEQIQCVAPNKGSILLPYLEAETADDLRASCLEEIEALRHKHPGKFEGLNVTHICRSALMTARLLKQDVAFLRKPPPPESPVYEICY